ncbi:DegV family protein [Candidatus Syntrophocurvum alkaliphilum]|uniref:DegV family protein n=1 Tax=Candidatus Syntrophocurvum alkaliphilum TaxID=2293317 RepID=A0A6I6D8F6_9FIRM|nr:DegV family protein [Candidatus Syntrophocurvum alkaliphilum]QGT98837.1 DegV family protein [Candidatus Syntrophocurvum alkaliphilum]
MMRVVITDSTAYLPDDYIKENNIKVVPLNVHLGNEVFKEGYYDNKTYYNRLRNEKIFPSTSQPAVGEFLEIYEQLKPGDEAFVIVLSAALSGTYQSAEMAKDLLKTDNIKIHLVDSKSAAIGLGFQIYKVQEMLDSNETTENIINEIYKIQQNGKLFFAVGNLEYLVRGGRVSHLSGFLGNILQMKPILTLEDGKISLHEKVRTSQKAYHKMMDYLITDIDKIEKISLLHVDALEELKILEEILRAHYTGPIVVTEPGPVIGSHVGPGTVGIAYY